MFWVLVQFGEFCGFEQILQVEVSRCDVLFLAGLSVLFGVFGEDLIKIKMNKN
jgi:hypothetical protein